MDSATSFIFLALVVLTVNSAKIPTNNEREIDTPLHQTRDNDQGNPLKNLLSFTKRKAAFEQLKREADTFNKRGYTCEKDGITYEPFEKVPVPGCAHECHCPEYGGSVRCKKLRCPVPLCIDPVTSPGSCCPSCENGENCKVGKKVIAGYGLDVLLPGGNCKKACRCPGKDAYAEQGPNTQAECTSPC